MAVIFFPAECAVAKPGHGRFLGAQAGFQHSAAQAQQDFGIRTSQLHSLQPGVGLFIKGTEHQKACRLINIRRVQILFFQCLQQQIQLLQVLLSIIKTQQRHAYRPGKGRDNMLILRKQPEPGRIFFRNPYFSLAALTAEQIKTQGIFHKGLQSARAPGRIHQPVEYKGPSGGITVMGFILQKDLIILIINRHIGSAILHRIGLLAPQPGMDDYRLPDIRSLAVQLLHEKKGRHCLAVIPGQHFFIQDGLIQIRQMPVDAAFIELLQHEAVYLALVGQVQLRELFPVLLQIGIQVGAVFIIQIALVSKIHEYNAGDFHFLIQIHRHHIIFIQPGNPQLLLHAPAVPQVIFRAAFIPLNQQGTDGGKQLRITFFLIAGLQNPEQALLIIFFLSCKIDQMPHQILGKDSIPGAEMQKLQFIGIQLHHQGWAEIRQMQSLQIQHGARPTAPELFLQKQPFLGNASPQGRQHKQQKPGNPPVIPVYPVKILHLYGNLCGKSLIPVIQAAQIQIITVKLRRFIVQGDIQMFQNPSRIVKALLRNQKMRLIKPHRRILIIQPLHPLHHLSSLRPPQHCIHPLHFIILIKPYQLHRQTLHLLPAPGSRHTMLRPFDNGNGCILCSIGMS